MTTTTATFEFHYRDRFWTRNQEGDKIHCTAKGDDSPVHSSYQNYDSKCSYCYLNASHTEAVHQQEITRK